MNTLTNSNRWLDVYSCVIFAYIISRRDVDNNGALAGAPLLPTPLKFPSLPPFEHLTLKLQNWSENNQNISIFF